MPDTPRDIVFIVREAEEGGYWAQAVGHAIFTQGETADEIHDMVRDAVACHFDDADRPMVIHLQWIRSESIAA